jgi:quinolinate synthase
MAPRKLLCNNIAFARPFCRWYGQLMANPSSKSAAPFPSLVIRRDELSPRGGFANAQASYLDPDPHSVAALERLLRQKNVGVVAHFYMDPKLQGVLAACDWPLINIGDSLEMAGRAAEMARLGARAVAVLGVDFMAENARATVDAAGFKKVPVYRVCDRAIGCSLATAARSSAYAAYLDEASRTGGSLHVIYVNTGLDVKARAQLRVPTITCTSSNVVQMVLRAHAQLPDLNVWFGPDAHMGSNLVYLFKSLVKMDPSALCALYPEQSKPGLQSIIDRFHYFEQGTCVVHDMFGNDVADRVRRDYSDAYLTAHLEVPGELFALALTSQFQARGVVGSTANIGQFIEARVRAAASAGESGVLQFVLGTEAGMITSIVRRAQAVLRESPEERVRDLAVEIVFPVADEAIASTSDPELQIVPGVSGGEGCSAYGGCATCQYMKMNSLEALFELLERIDVTPPETLSGYEPYRYNETIEGHDVAALGRESILYMVDYQRDKRLPEALLAKIERTRNRGRAPTPKAQL